MKNVTGVPAPVHCDRHNVALGQHKAVSGARKTACRHRPARARWRDTMSEGV
jgi:hypothetical protein